MLKMVHFTGYRLKRRTLCFLIYKFTSVLNGTFVDLSRNLPMLLHCSLDGFSPVSAKI